MPSLKAFHLFFIWASIVLASGFGMWGLLHQYVLLGAISLCAGALLVAYLGYFVRKGQNVRPE